MMTALALTPEYCHCDPRIYWKSVLSRPLSQAESGKYLFNGLYPGDTCQQPQNRTLTEQLGCKCDTNKRDNTPPRQSTCLFAQPIRPPKGVLGPPFKIFHTLIQIQSGTNDAWRRLVALRMMTISSTWCGAARVPAARRAAAVCRSSASCPPGIPPNSPPIVPLQRWNVYYE